MAKTPKVQALTHFFCMEYQLLPSIPGTHFGSPGHLCFFQALPEKTNLNSPGTVETKSAFVFPGFPWEKVASLSCFEELDVFPTQLGKANVEAVLIFCRDPDIWAFSKRPSKCGILEQ